MGKILVTAKVNPDLDGTAGALAYADLLRQKKKDAEALIFGEPQAETRFFTENFHLNLPTQKEDALARWDNFILVDASSMKGMPKVVQPEKVTEVIDHREGSPEKEFPYAKIQNELIGAAATLIVERFLKANLKPKPDHAKLLYGAIFHNTLNFLASNTDLRDKNAARYLEENFKLKKEMIEQMFRFSTEETVIDPKRALEMDAKEFGDHYTIRAYQLIVFGSEIFKKRKEIEEAITELNKKLKVDWGFLNIIDLKEKKSSLYVRGEKGEKILARIFNVIFKDGWTKLPKVLLRKQIIPMIVKTTQEKL